MRNDLNKERTNILQSIAGNQEHGIIRRGSLEEIELKSIDDQVVLTNRLIHESKLQ